MPKYIVETKFIFSGEFLIEAESAVKAEEHVAQNCNMEISGDLFPSLPKEEGYGWKFNVHPDKEIGLIKVKR